MITRKTAEQALAAVIEQFAVQPGDPQPEIKENWHWTETPARWALVWEEGPYEWALRAGTGGLDEEATDLLQDFAPGARIETPPAASWPPGTYAEAITTWAVAVVEG